MPYLEKSTGNVLEDPFTIQYQMERNAAPIERIALPLLCGGLTIWAILLAQQPLPELTGDPHNIMARSLRVAETGNIFATVDPPLRYVPLAIVFQLFNIESAGAMAAQTTHLYSTLLSHVIVPASLYALVRATVNRWTALATLSGVVVWRLLGIGLNAYTVGYWMYDYTLPFIFAALYLAHRTVLTETTPRRFILAAGTGLVIGAVGLNEYILGAYTAASIATLYVTHRLIQELAVTGAVGGLMASSLLFMPEYAKEYIFSAGGNRLELLGVPSLAGNAVGVLTTPAYLVPVGLATVSGSLYYWTRSKPTSSGILIVACGVCGVAWLSQFVLVSSWFAFLAQYTSQYLLLALACHQLIAASQSSKTPPPARVKELGR